VHAVADGQIGDQRAGRGLILDHADHADAPGVVVRHHAVHQADRRRHLAADQVGELHVEAGNTLN